jgi:peptide/nickel transport system substrate-binding protein
MSSWVNLRSKHLLLAIGVAVALVVAACGGGKGSSGDSTGVVPTTISDEGKPVAGGSLTVGLEAESSGWQPCVDSHSEAGAMVMLALYDPLMSRTADGKVEPFLAESLTPNADLTEWTLKLRPGVKFSDGTALTAQTIKDNWDNGIKAATSRCAGAAKPVTEVRVVDDRTITYVLGAPFGPFADLLTGPLGWPWSPDNAAKYGPDVSSHPSGTGAFRARLLAARFEDRREEEPELLAAGLPPPRRGHVPAHPRRGRPPGVAVDRRARHQPHAAPAVREAGA